MPRGSRQRRASSKVLRVCNCCCSAAMTGPAGAHLAPLAGPRCELTKQQCQAVHVMCVAGLCAGSDIMCLDKCMQQPVCMHNGLVLCMFVCLQQANAARALQLGTTHGAVTALSCVSVAAHVFALHDRKAQRGACICLANQLRVGCAFIVSNLILTLNQIGWLQWPASVTSSTHYYCGCLLSCVTHPCHCIEASHTAGHKVAGVCFHLCLFTRALFGWLGGCSSLGSSLCSVGRLGPGVLQCVPCKHRPFGISV